MSMRPKLRVWVVFPTGFKFGDGRAQLLEAIDELGSLQRAVARFDMSYRSAWGYLRELERAAGFAMLERTPGRGRASGMKLTARGRDFVARYRRFRRGLDAVAERGFTRAFRTTERPRDDGQRRRR